MHLKRHGILLIESRETIYESGNLKYVHRIPKYTCRISIRLYHFLRRTIFQDICHGWLRFEREHGALEDFDHAVQKVLLFTVIQYF